MNELIKRTEQAKARKAEIVERWRENLAKARLVKKKLHDLGFKRFDRRCTRWITG